MLLHLLDEGRDSIVTLASWGHIAIPWDHIVQFGKRLLLFTAKKVAHTVDHIGEHALVSLLDFLLGEVIPISLALRILHFLIHCDVGGPIEVLDELLATNFAALVSIHHREELLDLLQVFLHQALLQTFDCLSEFLEADLAGAVLINAVEELRSRDFALLHQIDEPLHDEALQFDVAFPTGTHANKMVLATHFVRLKRVLVLLISDITLHILVENVQEASHLCCREHHAKDKHCLLELLVGHTPSVGVIGHSEKRFRCQLLCSELRYKFVHNSLIWVFALGGTQRSDLLFALLSDLLYSNASGVLLELALNLGDLRYGIGDAHELILRLREAQLVLVIRLALLF